jgi:hypothetical protein
MPTARRNGRPAGSALHRVEKLAAEREDLVRVALHGAADLRQHQRAAAPFEEGLAELPLELPDLGADRGLREPQHARGPRDAASRATVQK